MGNRMQSPQPRLSDPSRPVSPSQVDRGTAARDLAEVSAVDVCISDAMAVDETPPTEQRVQTLPISGDSGSLEHGALSSSGDL